MDKKQPIEIKNKERFLRAFGREVQLKYYFSRLGFGKRGTYMGRITSNGVKLYRTKAGLLTLFALTATVVLEREGGRDLMKIRFGRSLAVTLFWGLWCFSMIFSGILLFKIGWSLALLFLLPGIFGALPLFLFSKKEKKRLTEYLQNLAE